VFSSAAVQLDHPPGEGGGREIGREAVRVAGEMGSEAKM